ncbi:MAG: helix-turn-helix domain-containing protein [Candidatus Eremiobacteraeota bacterium]|nr:helix-turn-helix domain-containing protein [Candidatus Eremiobacteraeota bacterium]MBV8364978.1 helix-turn-helix domain-containing protein [Candidatus Eremiobacteraeota bacterium]
MNRARRLHAPDDVLATAAGAAAADPAALDACRRLLAGLRRADAERGSDLERTLRTYYTCGASVSAAAEALFLHRNSVRYRLDRVRALLGAELEHPLISAALLAAFAIDDASRKTAIDDEAQRAQ